MWSTYLQSQFQQSALRDEDQLTHASTVGQVQTDIRGACKRAFHLVGVPLL